MKNGWMLNRHELKPLEEILKLAEVTKQTEDAVNVLDNKKLSLNTSRSASDE